MCNLLFLRCVLCVRCGQLLFLGLTKSLFYEHLLQRRKIVIYNINIACKTINTAILEGHATTANVYATLA